MTFLYKQKKALFTFSVKEFGQARHLRCSNPRQGNSPSPIPEEQSTADGVSQLAETLTGKVNKAQKDKVPGLIFLVGCALLLFCLQCCTSPASLRNRYLFPYHNGYLDQAERAITQDIQQQMPSKLYTGSKNAVWYLLNRATIRFAMGCTEGAIEDYDLAIDAMDYYNQKCAHETLGQVLAEDTIAAYEAAYYEQVLARVYFSLALMQKGDFTNAEAVLRQAENLQQNTDQSFKAKCCRSTVPLSLIQNPIAKYLFACLLERRGDLSNAKLLYKQAGQLIGMERVCHDLERIDCRDSHEKASVIILCHNGNAPYRISTPVPASQASAFALEMLLANHKRPFAFSSLPGIPAPQLVQSKFSIPLPTRIQLGNLCKPSTPWYDVRCAAVEQLNHEMPFIVARGVARFVLRRSALAAISNQSESMGAVTDLALFIVNAATEADTRCWDTLPQTIELTRFDVTPGCQPLQVQVMLPGCPPMLYNHVLNLQKGDLCIINIFNIHPNVTYTHIPKHFKGAYP